MGQITSLSEGCWPLQLKKQRTVGVCIRFLQVADLSTPLVTFLLQMGGLLLRTRKGLMLIEYRVLTRFACHASSWLCPCQCLTQRFREPFLCFHFGHPVYSSGMFFVSVCAPFPRTIPNHSAPVELRFRWAKGSQKDALLDSRSDLLPDEQMEEGLRTILPGPSDGKLGRSWAVVIIHSFLGNLALVSLID